MRSKCHSLRHLEGYTLVELVMVIALGCLMLGLVVPNLHRLQQEWNLWGSAHSLEASLQWGRMHAISANTSTTLEVAGNGSQFYWVDPVNGETYRNTAHHLPGGVRITQFPKRRLRFYSRGNAAPAGTYVLQGATGSYSVVVSPGGRIRMQKN